MRRRFSHAGIKFSFDFSVPLYLPSSLSSFRNLTRTSAGRSPAFFALDADDAEADIFELEEPPSSRAAESVCLANSGPSESLSPFSSSFSGAGVPERLSPSSVSSPRSFSNSAGSGPLARLPLPPPPLFLSAVSVSFVLMDLRDGDDVLASRDCLANEGDLGEADEAEEACAAR